ncbi:hypothetical protein [Nitrolancea hollandica]|uniref:Uncharacterized protein n=1 Tax=Nitrolancea hollandica Lb TaxID=1129897 RepID=I4EG43_9BACT|nr:hypothetical protein [Nitrolancea hollandica]CCF83655.1 hypothetical protein NITHO_2520030 [Nitrolancea hollandica Lb]
MFPRIAGRPVHDTSFHLERDAAGAVTAIRQERTGSIRVDIEWLASPDDATPARVDHGRVFASWADLAFWLELHAASMADTIDEADMPEPVRAMVVEHATAGKARGQAAADLATGIRQALAANPRLEDRLAVIRHDHQHVVAQRAEARREAERKRLQQMTAVAQIAQAKQAAAEQLAREAAAAGTR